MKKWKILFLRKFKNMTSKKEVNKNSGQEWRNRTVAEYACNKQNVTIEFYKNEIGPMTRSSGTMLYFILYFNLRRGNIRPIYLYSVISAKIDWLPDNGFSVQPSCVSCVGGVGGFRLFSGRSVLWSNLTNTPVVYFFGSHQSQFLWFWLFAFTAYFNSGNLSGPGWQL